MSITIGGCCQITHIEGMPMISITSLKEGQPQMLCKGFKSLIMPLHMRLGNKMVGGRMTTLASIVE
jgi:hypothetical protein